MIKVSIITIVYNAERTVEDTILSVVNQTYKNIEYIVIDGKSTDGSIKIIEKYLDRISLFISEPDKGISDAFNKGIGLATGDLIGIINADDWYSPNAIETVISNITNIHDVYCGNLKQVTEDRQIKHRRSKINWLNLGMYIMHPTVFVTPRVYKVVGGFDVNLKIAMDFDMMLRIKKAKFKFKYIDADLVYMRTGGASSNIKNVRKEELIVMKRHLSLPVFLTSKLFNQLNWIRLKLFHKHLFQLSKQVT